MNQRVIFRKWRDTGEVIAYLIDLPETPGTVLSYMHVGQHSQAHYPQPGTVLATPDEYMPLLEELRLIGYDNLRVVQRWNPRRKRS